MIKNLIGAKLGAEIAKKSTKVGTKSGAALGAIAPLAIARLSLPALVAVGAGGYLLKRYRDRSAARNAATGSVSTSPSGAVLPPAQSA